MSVTRKSFLIERMNYGAAITPRRSKGLVSAKAYKNNLLKSWLYPGRQMGLNYPLLSANIWRPQIFKAYHTYISL